MATPAWEYNDDPSTYFNEEMNDAMLDESDAFGMGDDEFVDAPEHQPQEDVRMNDIGFKQQDPAEENQGDASSSYILSGLPPNPYTFDQSAAHFEPKAEPEEEQVNEEPIKRQRLRARYDPASEPEEKISVNKQTGSNDYAAAYLAALKKSTHSSQSDNSGEGSAAPNTITPAVQQPLQPLPSLTAEAEPKLDNLVGEKPWLGPDDLRDVSKPIQREKRWHDKVAHLHPQVPLAPHRYWIGILNPNVLPRNACKETHFTWMKGNRLTTVETVRKVYAATTMLELVFMMGGERPEDGDRMEQLDLFNDKIVLFSVVEEGTPESVGRKITEGLVTKEREVIELLD